MKKQALLIGINEYAKNGSLNNLRFARQDAEGVSLALQQFYGFTEDEITLMTCGQEGTLSPATPQLILNQLRPEQFPEPLDLFIFGFWGHGIWENSVRYLCPMTTLENNLSESCLPVGEVTQRISTLPIHNFCFIFDCCQSLSGRGNAQFMPEQEIESLKNLGRDIVLKGPYINRARPERTFSRNVAVLNSCRQGEIAYEWDEKQHGIFTAHLLEAMEQRLDTVNKWTAYLDNKVSKTAARLGKNSQTPFYSLEGCIELPVVQGDQQSGTGYFVKSHSVTDKTMEQAALKLVELFQESARIHDNNIAKDWFLHQKDKALSVYIAITDGSINGQKAYSQLYEIAQNAGNWINDNRNRLGGKKLVYISYLWYSWVEFANNNNLENLSKALNP